MKLPWFRRFGIFFLPSTVMGGLILLGFVAYSVVVFLDIDRRSHSVSDTLINFVFNLGILAVLYSAVAFATSFKLSR